MMASGIIFFAGRRRAPQGFLAGTLCSATLSFGVLTVLSPFVPSAIAQGAAAGTLLVWYKATIASSAPAAMLAGALTAVYIFCRRNGLLHHGDHAFQRPSHGSPATPFCTPPRTLSYTCGQRRVRLTVRLHALHDLKDDALYDIFLKFDTDASGALDADELKVALRVALGVDLSTRDCEALVRSQTRMGRRRLISMSSSLSSKTDRMGAC